MDLKNNGVIRTTKLQNSGANGEILIGSYEGSFDTELEAKDGRSFSTKVHSFRTAEGNIVKLQGSGLLNYILSERGKNIQMGEEVKVFYWGVDDQKRHKFAVTRVNETADNAAIA